MHWHRLGVQRRQLQHSPFEHPTRSDDPALRRREGGELRAAWPGRKVDCGLFALDLVHDAINPHLVPCDRPVEDERSPAVMRYVAAFPAVVVGVEDERAVPQTLVQDHARGRSLFACRRQRHRVGLRGAGVHGLTEPFAEKLVGVAWRFLFQKRHQPALSWGTYLRSCSSAARCSRETCIWLIPRRRAISD